MPGSDVSTVDRRTLTWKKRFDHGLKALALCLVIGWVMYALAKFRAADRMEFDIVAIKAYLMNVEADQASEHKNINKRLDEMETVLFGDVLTKLEQAQAKVKPSPIQAWQANRDKSFRDRLDQLERARLELQERIWRLEREIKELR